MTDHYAVIGNPIAHSKSPWIHAAFARATGQDLDYTAILAPFDGFPATVAAFRREGGCGANVTLPFKLEAHALATEVTERAQAAQAVNTLRFDGAAILGDNTDGVGLVRDIERNLGVVITDKRVLVMGAGGATRGVLGPLLKRGPASLFIANRTVYKAIELAALFADEGNVEGGGYERLARRGFDVVINATSASLAGELPPLPDSVFEPGALAYDMMYGRGTTPFLQRAKADGVARAVDGLGMLVEQAAESFFMWRGVRPETASVIEMLRGAKQ